MAKKNDLMLDLIYDQAEENELYHHGILGMHWGVRRFQPYGQGYDPKNEGKEVGLAARMAGHTGSYSSMYGRSRSKSEMAKAALRNFGSRAKKGLKEGFERAEYAADRFDRGVQNAGRKSREALLDYGATISTPNGHRHVDPMLRALIDFGGKDNKALVKNVRRQFAEDAKQKVSDIRKTSWDDVRSAMGNGASRFKSAMEQTGVKSKQFSTNAQATMALLRGAMDPRSSASQILEGRYTNSKTPLVKSMAIETANATSPRDYLKYIRGDLAPIGGNKYWQGKPGNSYALSRGASAEYKIPEMANFRTMMNEQKGLDTPLTISPSYRVAGGKYESVTERQAKRMGVVPMSDVSSSSSTDLGKRLLGL